MRVKPRDWKRLHLDPPLHLFPALTEITHERHAAESPHLSWDLSPDYFITCLFSFMKQRFI